MATLRILAALPLLAACGLSGKPSSSARGDAGKASTNAVEPSAQVSITEVEERAVGKAIVTSARIVFDENKVAHVFSPVTGRVTEIVAQLGQRVKRGQTLAVITSPDMGNAMSDVSKAKPAVIQTGRELARQKELFAAKAGTQRDLEAAQAANDQAVAELQRASEKLRLLMERAHVDKVMQTFPLVSPIDGEVVARSINPGTEVQGQYSGGTSLELYTIGRQDDLWVLSDVYEQDLARVKLGAQVEVATVAYPDKRFEGKVDWIADTLDPVMRTVAVRCTLPNPEHLLKAQMYATVSIETEGKRALAVPRNAIVHFGEKTMVITAGPAGYERLPVIVDEGTPGDWVPVIHGLAKGQRIVGEGALLASELAK